MGLIASLTQACVRGRKSTIVANAVMKKFIYAKMLRLAGWIQTEVHYNDDSDTDA